MDCEKVNGTIETYGTKSSVSSQQILLIAPSGQKTESTFSTKIRAQMLKKQISEKKERFFVIAKPILQAPVSR